MLFSSKMHNRNSITSPEEISMPRKTHRTLTLLLWIAAVGWIGVLFFFSGQSGEQSAGLSLRFTRWLLRALPSLPFAENQLHPILRKIAHFGIFAVEGFLLGLALMRTLPSPRRAALLAIPICAAMAVLNELHQNFMAGRSCEARDMIIDTSGAILGVAAAAILLLLLRRILRRRNVNIS